MQNDTAPASASLIEKDSPHSTERASACAGSPIRTCFDDHQIDPTALHPPKSGSRDLKAHRGTLEEWKAQKTESGPAEFAALHPLDQTANFTGGPSPHSLAVSSQKQLPVAMHSSGRRAAQGINVSLSQGPGKERQEVKMGPQRTSKSPHFARYLGDDARWTKEEEDRAEGRLPSPSPSLSPSKSPLVDQIGDAALSAVNRIQRAISISRGEGDGGRGGSSSFSHHSGQEGARRLPHLSLLSPDSSKEAKRGPEILILPERRSRSFSFSPASADSNRFAHLFSSSNSLLSLPSRWISMGQSGGGDGLLSRREAGLDIPSLSVSFPNTVVFWTVAACCVVPVIVLIVALCVWSRSKRKQRRRRRRGAGRLFGSSGFLSLPGGKGKEFGWWESGEEDEETATEDDWGSQGTGDVEERRSAVNRREARAEAELGLQPEHTQVDRSGLFWLSKGEERIIRLQRTIVTPPSASWTHTHTQAPPIRMQQQQQQHHPHWRPAHSPFGTAPRSPPPPLHFLRPPPQAAQSPYRVRTGGASPASSYSKWQVTDSGGRVLMICDGSLRRETAQMALRTREGRVLLCLRRMGVEKMGPVDYASTCLIFRPKEGVGEEEYVGGLGEGLSGSLSDEWGWGRKSLGGERGGTSDGGDLLVGSAGAAFPRQHSQPRGGDHLNGRMGGAGTGHSVDTGPPSGGRGGFRHPSGLFGCGRRGGTLQQQQEGGRSEERSGSLSPLLAPYSRTRAQQSPASGGGGGGAGREWSPGGARGREGREYEDAGGRWSFGSGLVSGVCSWEYFGIIYKWRERERRGGDGTRGGLVTRVSVQSAQGRELLHWRAVEGTGGGALEGTNHLGMTAVVANFQTFRDPATPAGPEGGSGQRQSPTGNGKAGETVHRSDSATARAGQADREGNLSLSPSPSNPVSPSLSIPPPAPRFPSSSSRTPLLPPALPQQGDFSSPPETLSTRWASVVRLRGRVDAALTVGALMASEEMPWPPE
uniref:Uncharacterized protein n=1 Tax=Chromera velia CCMP2878 TaxID=1169474 RepID=A0A0G4HNC9_9ALVE|eukprot:Cvel_7670.t1-p1 / transcript=Cvel_7670.t1 / gene=Cvel_7670 / organism=Chromera_velia_CCMP2878 / gene_product=hypothetical protein / transcript_product=hypothetical protein / location=Cvel_scaffold407:14471-20971(-) / protein_length=986 / sequence_SO=supercontig / SO=protein_coding / is_pseudo=false